MGQQGALQSLEALPGENNHLAGLARAVARAAQALHQ
jgi:hypothetical protein